ncbi:MAG: hypothetical protein ICV77_17240, partial [Cyanobacteria bacterium Co-bin8]|nr:hypothetical protein [Cyanobacteria bacterium Co-bin8]
QEVRSSLDSAELRSLIAAQLQTLTWQAAAQPGATASNGRSLTSATEQPPSLTPQALIEPDFWQPIEAYLTETSSKSLTPKRLNRRLQKLLQSAYEAVPIDTEMPPLPTDLLAAQIDQREDLTDKKKQRILAQIETTWAEFCADLEPRSGPVDSSEAGSEAEDSTGFDPAAISQDLLKSAAETALKQVLSGLPDLLQKVKPDLPYGLGMASIMLAEALPDLQPESLLDSLPVEAAEVRQYVDHLLDETQGQMAQLGKASLYQAEHLRELALKPVERVQQGVQARVDALKQQAREQAEATRKAAATAAWWLFATASTGAVSAALAGALATEWLWP